MLVSMNNLGDDRVEIVLHRFDENKQFRYFVRFVAFAEKDEKKLELGFGFSFPDRKATEETKSCFFRRKACNENRWA